MTPTTTPAKTTESAVAPFAQAWFRFGGLSAVLLLVGAVWTVSPAQAQGADIFKGADLALGEKMIIEHKCAACHISKVGGDGSAIFKPEGKFNTAGLMRGMVEMCNTNMNLGMFPEEVTAVAAVLNRDHYKFK